VVLRKNGEEKAMRKMFRYEVQVNDKPQSHSVGGKVRKVAARPWIPGQVPVVEFWAEDASPVSGEAPPHRTFQVFGTGHPLPDGAEWRGTTDRDPAGLVWHLYELA
jgi:hypothetical protein